MNDTPHRYTAELAGRIEVAWQDRWESEGTFHAPNPAGPWADPEGVAGRDTLTRYRDAWDRAADRTPHGTPIELSPDDFRPGGS